MLFQRQWVFIGFLLTTLCAVAQSYPSKPVRVVMPVAAGGVADILARAISMGLTESLGQPFIVENRPGASGIIGTEFVAKSAPDGYVLLFTGQTAVISLPFMKKDVPYDAVNGFIPIAMCCSIAQAVVINTSLKVNSVRELVELGKSNPGKLTYGSIGNAEEFAEFIRNDRQTTGPLIESTGIRLD